MDNLSLYNKLVNLPDNLKSEVTDFIDFLLSKSANQKKDNSPKPQFGSAKGTFIMHDNFNEPLEDFKDYM